MAELTKDFMQAVHDYLIKNKKSLALIGMMGVGKSEVGQILARKLSLPLQEVDEIIVESAGKSIAGIFKEEGEARFRELELQVTGRLLSEPCILSTGGGAYIEASTRGVIDQNAIAVWLNADPKEVYDRIKGDQARPLVGLSYEDYESRLDSRLDDYRKAPVHVDCRGLNVDEVAEKVLSNTAEHLKLSL